MKILLAIAVLVSTSGCGTFIMKDCKQQGGSQYYHCKRVNMLG